jgi:hypothetical protein
MIVFIYKWLKKYVFLTPDVQTACCGVIVRGGQVRLAAQLRAFDQLSVDDCSARHYPRCYHPRCPGRELCSCCCGGGGVGLGTAATAPASSTGGAQSGRCRKANRKLQIVERTLYEHACEKRHSFLSFSYVCPEPVLVK